MIKKQTFSILFGVLAGVWVALFLGIGFYGIGPIVLQLAHVLGFVTMVCVAVVKWAHRSCEY